MTTKRTKKVYTREFKEEAVSLILDQGYSVTEATNSLGVTSKAIRALLNQTRTQLQQTVNHTMVKTYWEVGHLIVEHEQKGEAKAAYGQSQIESLAKDLRKEFGKGFTARNLLNMRAFYLQNPIWHSVSTKLSWTHHRILLRVQNAKAREWYTQEAIENAWSVRALDRQIDKLYYDRLLMSKDKAPVIQEAETHTKPLQIDAKDDLRDPYIPNALQDASFTPGLVISAQAISLYTNPSVFLR